MITNKKVIETNIKGLEFTIKQIKRKHKITAKQKRALEEDCRILERQKRRLKILNIAGEEMYTRMYPYS